MQRRRVAQRAVWLAAQVPALRRPIFAYHDWRSHREGHGRLGPHPFDKAEGVRTSGIVIGLIKPGDPLDKPAAIYGGSQPSILRTALQTIPHRERCHFLDLGCGKGRPLLVATEFGFAAITGVELSPELARMARRNAAIFARRHPERTPIRIVTGDALAHPLPREDLAIFLYNPFPRPLIATLVGRIADRQAAGAGMLYVVSYNPVNFDLFDASPVLERRFAAQLPYDPGELGHGPDESDGVIVWQNRGNPNPRPPGDAQRPAVVIRADARVELSPA